jgi:hypothetical protein
MKRTTIAFFLLASVAVVITTGCSSKESEKRIAELESRLAELETSKGSGVNPMNLDEPIQAAPQEKPEGPLAVMEWEKTEHDFGTIKEGDVVEYTYKFRNTGDAPLIIQSAQPSCGCTVPDYSKNPVPPGGTGEVKVAFDSKGKPNMQNKTVNVTANTWPASTVLRFKTMVLPKQDVSTMEGPVRQ